MKLNSSDATTVRSLANLAAIYKKSERTFTLPEWKAEAKIKADTYIDSAKLVARRFQIAADVKKQFGITA